MSKVPLIISIEITDSLCKGRQTNKEVAGSFVIPFI